LDAKPNGIAAYENEVRHAYDNLEAAWLRNGAEFQIASSGARKEGGRIVDSGPDVERVRRIMTRLVPPYLEAARVRVRVIHTNEWNARAMGNGAIWVNKGLLDDVSDDELSVVLGQSGLLLQ
jgi:hypothetical protein